MRPLFVVLGVQLVIGVVFVALVVSGTLPFADGSGGGPAAKPRQELFDGPAAFSLLKMQVALGERPAGSKQSRELAARLKKLVPGGRYQAVPGGLRNVIGTVPGKEPDRIVVVGAHYDSKDIDGFVAANDGAGGTAAVVTLARQLKPRTIGPTVKFILFDGEEAPDDNGDFYKEGLRGSKVAARTFKHAEAMILLDFVADKDLSLPREGSSNLRLWQRLRSAANKAGVIKHFPDTPDVEVQDDHTPFLRAGVPAINLIDWDFDCWHETCDDLSAVSERSLDISGEAVAGLLRTL
jgi:hypothetical protein